MHYVKHCIMLLLVLNTSILFVACSHEHQFLAADCVNAEKCMECGETAGAALGHVWSEATCTAKKTCTRCGMVEGEYADHIWIEATCVEPMRCQVCRKSQGIALGHTVAIGVCKNCREIQNGEAVDKLNACLMEGVDYDSEAWQYVMAGADMIAIAPDLAYQYLALASSNFLLAKCSYVEAKEVCEDFPELRKLELLLVDVLDKTPSGNLGTTANEMLAYLGKVQLYAEEVSAMGTEMKNFLQEMQDALASN